MHAGKQALAQGSGRATGRSWGLQYQQPVGFVASGVQMEDGEVVQLLSRSMARTSLADDAAMPDAAPSDTPPLSLSTVCTSSADLQGS